MRLNDAKFYAGNARPMALYNGRNRMGGWRWAEQTGTDLAFEGAYDDHVFIFAQGKSVQIGEPSPNNPSPIYAANGDLVVVGRNIAATPTYFAGGSFNHSVYCQGELLPNTQYTISMIIPSGEMYYLNENLSTKYLGTPIGTGQRYVTTITTKSTISKINDLTYTPSRGWIIFKNQNGYASTTQDKKLMIERGIISHLYTPYCPIVTLPLPELRGIPNGQGGWIARDALGVVSGRLMLTRDVKRDILDGTYAVGNSSAVPPLNFASLTIPGTGRKTGQDIISTHFKTATGPTQTIITTATRDVIWGNPVSPQYGIVIALSLLSPYGATMDRATHPAAFRSWCANNPVTVDYILATPVITDLGPIDLPTHYPFTRILTQANAQTHGDLLPEVTARVKVVGL